MAKSRASRKRRVQRIIKPEKCFFCENKKEPGYKDYETLRKFITDRAKILGKERSGLCSGHQRMLSRSIKRARHLGFLPFTQSL